MSNSASVTATDSTSYTSEGNIQTKNTLLEESILPVSLGQRTIGFWGFIWMWVGMAVIIATYSLGASGVAGLPLEVVVITIFIANLALGLLMTLTADIGTEHGLSFAVYLRAPFGTKGTHLPAVSRGIVAAMWFGIQTYLGALALNGIVEYMTGYSGWVWWYILFAVVQIANTAMGIKAVERLASIAAPAIIAISVWMYYSLNGLAELKGINIWTFAGTAEVTVLALFIGNLAFWSALAVDIPNLTRFLKTKPGARGFFIRNKNVLAAQLLALPITQACIALIGAVSFIATGDWNPINVIQEQGEGITLVVLLVMVILAQWSTNTSANLIPAALTFVNAGAPKVTYSMGLIIAGVVGTLSMPWWILNNLFTFLGYYGAILSAVGGIMICDYYIIRRRRLNVPDLYRTKGQFAYKAGFNPAGMIAWVIGGGCALYFMDYAYVVGFPVAFISYYLLMKLWILPSYPQQEVVSDYSDKYLATSMAKSWVFNKETNSFTREGSLVDYKREDM